VGNGGPDPRDKPRRCGGLTARRRPHSGCPRFPHCERDQDPFLALRTDMGIDAAIGQDRAPTRSFSRRRTLRTPKSRRLLGRPKQIVKYKKAPLKKRHHVTGLSPLHSQSRRIRSRQTESPVDRRAFSGSSNFRPIPCHGSRRSRSSPSRLLASWRGQPFPPPRCGRTRPYHRRPAE